MKTYDANSENFWKKGCIFVVDAIAFFSTKATDVYNLYPSPSIQFLLICVCLKQIATPPNDNGVLLIAPYSSTPHPNNICNGPKKRYNLMLEMSFNLPARRYFLKQGLKLKIDLSIPKASGLTSWNRLQ
jgi:hypothetical protein